MKNTDPRIDAYIAKSQPFAQPILTHLRALVHKTLPGAEETIKWGMPFFVYEGALLANMAAFKQHAAFGFWKAQAMKDASSLLARGENLAMGHLGRMTSRKQMPPDKQLVAWLEEAGELNRQGVKTRTRKTPKPKKELVAPPELLQALRKSAKATRTWEAFSPSQRKAYLEWILEAKTEATRAKRIATTIEWVAEGKARMWKYERK